MNLFKYFIEEKRIEKYLDITCLFELSTDKGIYYLSLSVDNYSVGIRLYDDTFEDEIKNIWEENDGLEALDAAESIIEDFDEEIKDLFKINNIEEVSDQDVFDKWSSNWM